MNLHVVLYITLVCHTVECDLHCMGALYERGTSSDYIVIGDSIQTTGSAVYDPKNQRIEFKKRKSSNTVSFYKTYVLYVN